MSIIGDIWDEVKDFAGPVIGGFLGLKGQEDANESNVASAREAMAFQERMSSSAHQREVADLRAAGLNPVLSGTGGPGAPSGAGATAAHQSTLGAGVATAMAARKAEADVQLTREQKKLTEQQKHIAEHGVKGAFFDSHEREQNLWRTYWDQEMRKQQFLNERIHGEILRHQAKGWKIEGEIDESPQGRVYREAQRLGISASSALGAVRGMGGGSGLRRR